MGKNPEVDEYLAEGCGRCDKVGTPACKVNTWRDGLTRLRAVVLDTPLVEDRKWGAPCYTLNGTNVVMIGAFNNNYVLSFMKGALLKDPHQLLEAPGEHTQSGRVIRFTDAERVTALAPVLRDYVLEAIEIEKAGLKVELKQTADYEMPIELQAAMDQDHHLKEAYHALTPGRQRSYLIHIGGAKQAKTRLARIERCRDKIFAGKGFNEY
ncbi:MAG: YdeI/OmpD-associated family protein [Natronospirillum sp.]|uniref:YdeI/OmpD-associated family protein n=1 Tax=Natronospirillum sp. TaxID=2812955 RepID=UPI0025F3E3CA|nr:YdeI/OmpD-associated family protein [Natronospirillum sp.]MCH8552224.1 YdeI/OmpD-associated family protein [Natronospirillum sp.]